MNPENSVLKIAYMNIHGQSNIPTVKQLQIQDFIKYNKIDILHLQEIEIGDETFAECDFISSSYNVIPNNSENKYGTASLVRSDLDFKNVRCDTSGRAIVFDIGNVSFGNFYAHSGTDGASRTSRESFCGETIPNLFLNCQPSGCLGGDFNMIIDKKDATIHPEAKMSPSFKLLGPLTGLIVSGPYIQHQYNSQDTTVTQELKVQQELTVAITMVISR